MAEHAESSQFLGRRMRCDAIDAGEWRTLQCVDTQRGRAPGSVSAFLGMLPLVLDLMESVDYNLTITLDAKDVIYIYELCIIAKYLSSVLVLEYKESIFERTQLY